jgi:hypothetical protein
VNPGARIQKSESVFFSSVSFVLFFLVATGYWILDTPLLAAGYFIGEAEAIHGIHGKG